MSGLRAEIKTNQLLVKCAVFCYSTKSTSQLDAMHFTHLAIITLTSWAATGRAIPLPIPQFFDISDPGSIPTPKVTDKPFITTSAESGVDAHAGLLG
jgi:hypothetical protein